MFLILLEVQAVPTSNVDYQAVAVILPSCGPVRPLKLHLHLDLLHLIIKFHSHRKLHYCVTTDDFPSVHT